MAVVPFNLSRVAPGPQSLHFFLRGSTKVALLQLPLSTDPGAVTKDRFFGSRQPVPNKESLSVLISEWRVSCPIPFGIFCRRL